MKIKITSTDRTKWFVSYYGTGGMVPVKSEKIGNFFELTDEEFARVKANIGFIEPKIVRLFIPDHSAEVCDADC